MNNEVILSFHEVSFEYQDKKLILDEVTFSVRNGAKVTLMGQNGAGKSTIFGLIRGDIKPNHGNVHVINGATIGSARQVVAREDLDLSIEKYFAKAFEIVPANLKIVLKKTKIPLPLPPPITSKV